MQCSYIMFHIPRWLTRVPNRFGGKRDLAFFRGDIRDLSWKKGWEAGISVASGSGILCFYRAWMRDWEGKQSGIRDFNYTVTSSKALNSSVHIYKSGWREALWEFSVLPKNTTQCPRPGLDSGASALTMRPPRLPRFLALNSFIVRCHVTLNKPMI